MARCYIDGVLCHSKRLTGETAQPRGAGHEVKGVYAPIVTEEIDPDCATFDRERHAALTMELCRGLVPQQMVRNAQHPFRPDDAGRVLGSLRDGAALFRNGQGAAEIAGSQQKEVQAGDKAKLAPTVLESFRKRNSTLERGADLVAVTPGEHRR